MERDEIIKKLNDIQHFAGEILVELDDSRTARYWSKLLLAAAAARTYIKTYTTPEVLQKISDPESPGTP